MKWGGRMNLFRIAMFNIKKHKTATISLIILIFFCQLFLGLAIHNLYDNSHLFELKAKETQAVQNLYCINDSLYKDAYEQILKEDDRVSKVVVQDSIQMWESIIKLKNGQEYTGNSVFINGDAPNLLENIKLYSSMSEDQLDQIEHPIYAPYVVKAYYGFNEGDTLEIVYHQKPYTFVIAGFYETTIFANTNMGAIKYIISDTDYKRMHAINGGTKILAYNMKNLADSAAITNDFMTKAKEMADTGKSFKTTLAIDYNTLMKVATLFPQLLAYILLIFSIIILVTIFLVIRHRITSNIEEEMASIGTLEALGYTSKQITKIYMMEYGIQAIGGVVVAVIVSKFLAPVVNMFSFSMLGIKTTQKLALELDGLMLIGIVGVVLLISYSKARNVKKYPPVIAFRKGINNHHFKRNYFSLERAKGSVHFRLAAKRFMGAIRQNTIIAGCVMASTAVMIFSMILYACCGNNQSGIKKMVGFEVCDITIDITRAVEPEEFKKVLLDKPEVRKVNLSNKYLFESIQNIDVLSVVYPDYSELESLKASEGRMPIYDNEIGMASALAQSLGKEIGDTVEIESNGYSMKYLISGTVQSMMNNGQTLYFTDQGIKHIEPSCQSDELRVYLNEGVDKNAFIEELKAEYGKSIEDMEKELDDEKLTKEERIRAKAEAKIASLMSQYGVSSIDYAIMVDGKLIKGNSGIFAIESITNMDEYMQTNIGAVVQGINWGAKVIMLVAAVVIVVIIVMLVQGSITRQRMDLGIYKGLGYTTKELMLQIAVSLMPAVGIGVGGGLLLGLWSTPKILALAFRVIGVTNMMIDISPLRVIGLGIGIIIFSFMTAMVSAYRIKDVSVYELLTE